MSESKSKLSEKSVVILGCMNPEITEKITQIVKENEGIQLVMLEDKVVLDYVESQGVETSRSKMTDEERLKSFLSNKKNQDEAESHAMVLFGILSDNKSIADNDAVNRVYSKQWITKKTNMNYQQATELLDLLYAFGFIEYTNQKYEFKFVFGRKVRCASAKADVIQRVEELNTAAIRYREFMKQYSGMTEDEMSDDLIQLNEDVRKLIKI